MMSVGAMGGGQGSYYVGLAREDYYLEGGEPPGVWFGTGAERLGLTEQGGQVEKEAFLRLFQGMDPDGSGQRLVQNAGDARRQPGWDLTFSAPKSVSVLWAIANPEFRQAIQAAHFAAVKEACRYLEENAGITRRGHDGLIREKADLIFATFEHGTSRAQDPQLHTHALVLNLGVREDGTIGTILSKPFYESKMVAGALYRAELAHQMEQRGFQMERTGPNGSTCEVVGISRTLCDTFSTRRQEIEAALELRGEGGARASAIAALDTRQVKEHVSRDELFAGWAEAGKAQGLTRENIEALRQQRGPETDRETPEAEHIQDSIHEAVRAAALRITEDKSHFSERDLLRTVAEEAVGHGLPASLIRAATAQTIEESQKNGTLVLLAEVKGEKRYTTRELLETEKQLLSTVDVLKGGQRFAVAEKTLISAVRTVEEAETKRARAENPSAERRALSAEQKAALQHIAQGEGQIAAVAGMAGTGKTFLLQAAREAWEQEGYKVVGAAVAGKAAQGLNEGAGINSFTLARLLYEQKKGFGEQRGLDEGADWKRKLTAEFKHATWQIDGTAKKKMLGEYHKPSNRFLHEWKYQTFQISEKHRDFLNNQLERQNYLVEREKCRLDAKTVLVVDEAGMVGTRQMAALVAAVKEAGAKLILMGDWRQLQPVEIGGPFRVIAERVGHALLTSIIRQEIDKNDKNSLWKREAVEAFADGRAAEALGAFRDRGFLKIADNREGAMRELMEAWRGVTSKGGTKSLSENLIFAGTRAEAHDLNQMAQATRRVNGELGFRFVRVNGEVIHEKDRILITRNDRALGISNGDLGTVKRIELISQRMIVRLDDGREVVLPYRDFQSMNLGYAITTHKGQGVTVKNSFVLCGGAMADREISYVQASRARKETYFFTEKINVWDQHIGAKVEQTFEALSHRMSVSSKKEMAHDLTREDVHRSGQQDLRENLRQSERERVRELYQER